MIGKINWDKLLQTALEKVDVDNALLKAVQGRILHLDDLAEEIDVTKEVLDAFSSGKDIDKTSRYKIMIWWAEIEGTKTTDDELRQKLRLASLFVRLILYGTEERFERLIQLAVSIKAKKQKKPKKG
jgi:hypothetical protein